MFETITKFSERAGLSYWAVRKLVLAKQLPHIMVGNRYMIHVENALVVLANLAEQQITIEEDENDMVGDGSNGS